MTKLPKYDATREKWHMVEADDADPAPVIVWVILAAGAVCIAVAIVAAIWGRV